MALLGGGVGGAGNPVGGSFTGPAQALEIAGDFGYAFSGTFPATTAAQTAFDFTTGNYLFEGRITFNGPISLTGPGSGIDASTCTVKMNDSVIILMKGRTQNDPLLATVYNDIIIPSYTKIVVTLDASDDVATTFMTVSLTGRIYRD